MKVISNTKVISVSKNFCIIHIKIETSVAAINSFFDITNIEINSGLIIVFIYCNFFLAV